MWFEFSTGLKRETTLSSTPSPNVRVVQHVLDVKAWILPQMNYMDIQHHTVSNSSRNVA